MPTPAQLREAVDYYVSRLAYQYRTRKKARDNIAIYAKQALADLFALDVQAAYNLATAVGAQLDVIGKYVGVPRNIGPGEVQPYFEFSDYVGPIESDNGFKDYTDPALNTIPFFYDYTFSGTKNTDLTDSSYRMVIGLKILLNSSRMSLADIDTFLATAFPNGEIQCVDNADMSLNYTIHAELPVDQSVLQNYLPRPTGVMLNLDVSELDISVSDKIGVFTGLGPGPVTVYMGNQSANVTGQLGNKTYEWSYLSGSTEFSITPATGQVGSGGIADIEGDVEWTGYPTPIGFEVSATWRLTVYTSLGTYFKDFLLKIYPAS